MLLTLLTLTSSVTLFAGAFVAARQTQPGPGGWAVALIIGLSLAIGNAWMMYRAADHLSNFTSSYSESQQNRWGKAFMVVAVLWLPAAAFIGDWLTSAALRLIA